MDAALLRRTVEFCGEYADRLHHAKEEALLFRALERRGVPARRCPVGAPLAEHTRGRGLVTGFAERIEAYASRADGAAAGLAATMIVLAELYPALIWKEDYLLFPMTDKVLGEDDLVELAAQFSALNRASGEAALARIEALALEMTAIISQS